MKKHGREVHGIDVKAPFKIHSPAVTLQLQSRSDCVHQAGVMHGSVPWW